MNAKTPARKRSLQELLHNQPCTPKVAQAELEKFIRLAIPLHFHISRLHKPSWDALSRQGYMELAAFERELFHFIVNAARSTGHERGKMDTKIGGRAAKTGRKAVKPVFPINMPPEFARPKSSAIGKGYADWAGRALSRVHLYDPPESKKPK